MCGQRLTQHSCTVPEISAIVLAGGQSQRLGGDKALLRLGNEWLLEQILLKLSVLSQDVSIVSSDGEKLEPFGARVVPDMFVGLGPLGGIYSGLRSMQCARGLFVACDMPFLNLELLRYMILLSRDFDVVIPRIGEFVEPLHAIYSTACLGPMANALAGPERRVVRFLPQVRVRYIEEHESSAFDPQHWSWFNVNTPADLARAQELLGKG